MVRYLLLVGVTFLKGALSLQPVKLWLDLDSRQLDRMYCMTSILDTLDTDYPASTVIIIGLDFPIHTCVLAL